MWKVTVNETIIKAEVIQSSSKSTVNNKLKKDLDFEPNHETLIQMLFDSQIPVSLQLTNFFKRLKLNWEKNLIEKWKTCNEGCKPDARALRSEQLSRQWLPVTWCHQPHTVHTWLYSQFSLASKLRHKTLLRHCHSSSHAITQTDHTHDNRLRSIWPMTKCSRMKLLHQCDSVFKQQ
jgi:hypothetical protein